MSFKCFEDTCENRVSAPNGYCSAECKYMEPEQRLRIYLARAHAENERLRALDELNGESIERGRAENERLRAVVDAARMIVEVSPDDGSAYFDKKLSELADALEALDAQSEGEKP